MKNLVTWALNQVRVPQASRAAVLLLAMASAAAVGSGCVTTTDEPPGGDNEVNAGIGGTTDLGAGAGAQVSTCVPGFTECNGFCVDLSSNNTSCGTCGAPCQPGSSCEAGACACQPGATACSAGCTNTLADSSNCGACGTLCPGDQPFCSSGNCAAGCEIGLTECGTGCVDLQTSFSDCGNCGNACTNGTACVAGACQCPAGQTCDQGTPVGSGGTSGIGGSPGTGGAGTGGVGTGGAPATGGAGTGGDDGGDGIYGGYVTSFDWKGFAFTSKFGAATISPADYGDVTGFPLCASGSVPASATGANGAMIGLSINQSTEDGAPALTVTPTKDGIRYSSPNRGTSQLRLRIQGPTGATNANDRWCANTGTGGEGVVTWSQFNTECWPGGDGTAYAKQPISQVLVMIPAQAATAVSYDFCVDELSESDADGNQGGAGCDVDSGVGSPVSGTLTMANRYDRQFANNGTPQYAIQNNVFNAPGGLTFNLSYNGNSFEITSQTGSQSTGGAPVGYPSLFIGSNGGDGMATGGSNLAKLVSTLTDIPTAWSWTPPSSGAYNAAYDVWFAPGAGDQGSGSRSFLMVWFDRTSGIYAEGEGEGHSAGIFTVNGTNFEAFVSRQFENRPIISYVAQSRITNWSFDLNDFISDAKTRTSSGNNGAPAINDSLYLTNIFAGFEIWSGSQGIKTNGFCATVK